MLKKILKLPVSALSFAAAKVMGRNTAPAADAPPPPKRSPPRPPPARAAPAAEEDGHDHGHSHGHDHGHDHGHGGAPAAGTVVTVTAEDTPNPNARKFSCSVKVIEQGSLSFANATEAQKHPLGKAVFAVGGVNSVFAVNDFVTVTKAADQDWGNLTPKLVKAISAALSS